MTFRFAAVLILFCLNYFVAAAQSTPARRVSFNEGWRFHKGDASGAHGPSFDDSAWRRLDLPHDWAIEGPFDVNNDPNTGGLPVAGIGWYRKYFQVPAGAGLFYSLEIDGAMSNSTIWLNGHEIGGRPYGYSSFEVDLTPHLQSGQDNVVAVRLAPEEQASRWYPGAGIYRNVWLVTTGPVHVAHWGTYVTTPRVMDASASVSIRTEIQNRKTNPITATLQTEIRDSHGNRIVGNSSDVKIEAGKTATVMPVLDVPNPQRWSIDRPYLYQAVTTVRSGTDILDRYETPFGIRTIEFDPQKGFVLNGKPTKIRGVCNHHDLGALGAAINRRALERQLDILREMGVNAIRTSHNPPAPELLELCDRKGFLVMDEAFDMWNLPKVKNGAAKYFKEWGERDIRDMVRRDRNHPSIVLWSIGNEILEQFKTNGWETAKFLATITRQEDLTRPTTAGFNEWIPAIRNELAAQVDVPAFNYKPMYYEQIRREHPKWVIFGSETASCVSSRGVYHLPLKHIEKDPSLQVSSYDVIAPPWAYCPDVEFEAQDKIPAVAGEFVWTGFDYLGEPTPYGSKKDWPSRSSYFGIVDLAGFAKDRYFLYQSVWTGKPVLHLLPHWNWAGHEGETIPVMAYTNVPEVELFLNEKSLGRKKLGVDTVTIPVGPNVSKSGTFLSRYRLEWDVPYQPGRLRAVGYRGGKAVASDMVQTAGAPARIRLFGDRPKIMSDGQDLAFITVRIEDAEGNLVPGADNLVRFSVTGVGKREAVDNGNAASTEPFQADNRTAFSGMALLIVRPDNGPGGRIDIKAESDGLMPGILTIGAGR